MAMLRSFIGKLALPLLCLLVLNGCTQKIDASSKEALDASVAKVTKDMTDEERKHFRKAMGHIAIESLKLYDLFRKPPTDPQELKKALQPAEEFRALINGKTVAEVLKMGDEAKAKQAARQAAAAAEMKAQGLPPAALPAGIQAKQGAGASSVLKPPVASPETAAGPKAPAGSMLPGGAGPAPAPTPAASTPPQS